MSGQSKMVVLLTMAVACACTAALAQQPPTPAVPAVQPTPRVAPLQPGQAPFYSTSGSSREQAQVSKLTKQFVKAQKDDEKKEIRKKLTELLAKQFDLHVQQQQKELEDLEKQIAALRATLKKRVEAKTSIVDRRVDQLILDAEGMGWTVPSNQRSGGGFVSSTSASTKRETGPKSPPKQPRN